MNKIDYETRECVYNDAIDKFGDRAQIIVAVEEMSELTKELCKYLNDRQDDTYSIAEEIADVTVMMEQLRIIFECNDDVCEQMDFKIERLSKRIYAKIDK